MTSIRLQALNQICATPNRTARELSYVLRVPVNQVRLAIYTLQGAGRIVKTNDRRPFRYEFGNLQGMTGKQLPEFVESLKTQQQDEYSRTWKPKRDLVLFFVGLRG